MSLFSKSKKFLSIGLVALSVFTLVGTKKANAMWPTNNNQWPNSQQTAFSFPSSQQTNTFPAFKFDNNQFNAYTSNFQSQQNNVNNIFVTYNNTYNNSQTVNFSNTPVIQNSNYRPAKPIKDLTEKEKIEITRRYMAARRNGKNLTMAAQVLGISKSTLNNWEDKYFDAKVSYSAEEKRMHANRCRAMMSQGYTMQFYADENGLIASTLGTWLKQY